MFRCLQDTNGLIEDKPLWNMEKKHVWTYTQIVFERNKPVNYVYWSQNWLKRYVINFQKDSSFQICKAFIQGSH